MLVLGRRKDQAIVLRDRNTKQVIGVIKVLRCTGNVGIGFDFPPDIEIIREELMDGLEEPRE